MLIRGDLTADIPFTCTAGALTSSQERFENFIHSHNPLLQLHFGPTELFEGEKFRGKLGQFSPTHI